MVVPKCPPSILPPLLFIIRQVAGLSHRWVIIGKEPKAIMCRYDQNSRGRDWDINTKKVKNIVNMKWKRNNLDNMVLLNFYVITHNIFSIKNESCNCNNNNTTNKFKKQTTIQQKRKAVWDKRQKIVGKERQGLIAA